MAPSEILEHDSRTARSVEYAYSTPVSSLSEPYESMRSNLQLSSVRKLPSYIFISTIPQIHSKQTYQRMEIFRIDTRRASVNQKTTTRSPGSLRLWSRQLPTIDVEGTIASVRAAPLHSASNSIHILKHNRRAYPATVARASAGHDRPMYILFTGHNNSRPVLRLLTI